MATIDIKNFGIRYVRNISVDPEYGVSCEILLSYQDRIDLCLEDEPEEDGYTFFEHVVDGEFNFSYHITNDAGIICATYNSS
jgi:hypothetical protein